MIIIVFSVSKNGTSRWNWLIQLLIWLESELESLWSSSGYCQCPGASLSSTTSFFFHHLIVTYLSLFPLTNEPPTSTTCSGTRHLDQWGGMHDTGGSIDQRTESNLSIRGRSIQLWKPVGTEKKNLNFFGAWRRRKKDQESFLGTVPTLLQIPISHGLQVNETGGRFN